MIINGKNIPDEYIAIAQSPEISEACEKIGNQFGLHIDQIGEMDAEISDIIMGTSESKDIVKNLARRLEIDEKKAEEITKVVNVEILQTIRTRLLENTQKKEMQNLEKAGGFEIEKDQSAPIEKMAENNMENKQEIINQLENPNPAPSKMVKNEETLPMTEPLVDHLLENPVAQAEIKDIEPRKVEIKIVDKMVPPPKVEPKRAGPDPYREAV